MKVFVTGATGAIGRFVVPQLAAAGHEVSAIGRTPEKAAQLREQAATPVEVSLFDTAALTAAFTGHAAVLNLATSIPPLAKAGSNGAWTENDRIRTEGSAAVADAAIAAGVDRLVQESITFGYTDQGAEWIDEEAELQPTGTVATTAVAEANAQRHPSAVVLRFGAFYGPGSEQTDEMARLVRRHIGPVMGKPSGFISSIHLADAASACVAALAAPPGVYNVVDDEPLTKREWARALGAAVGTRPWLLLPGRWGALLGKKAGPLVRSQRVSNRRLRDATGWEPKHPSVRDGFATLGDPAHG
jgi:nucleoside-diphosphate-sugar epimerase